MINDNEPLASEALNRAAVKIAWEGTSVSSRTISLSAPVVKDDPRLIARDRIKAVHHRNAILDGIRNG